MKRPARSKVLRGYRVTVTTHTVGGRLVWMRDFSGPDALSRASEWFWRKRESEAGEGAHVAIDYLWEE